MRVGNCDMTFRFGAPKGQKGIGFHLSTSTFHEVKDQPSKKAKLTTEVGVWANSDHAQLAYCKLSGQEFEPELVDKTAEEAPKVVAAVEAPAEPVAEAA
jgi:hypothetical protein